MPCPTAAFESWCANTAPCWVGDISGFPLLGNGRFIRAGLRVGEVKLLFWLGVLFKALFRLPLLAVSDPFGFDADDSSLTSGPVGVKGTPPADAGADAAADDGVGVPVLNDDAATPVSPFAPRSPGVASAVAPRTPFSTVPLAPSCPTVTVGIDASGVSGSTLSL